MSYKLGQAEYMRRYRARRIAEGVCTRCGEDNDRPGKWECSECYRYLAMIRSEA